MSGHSHWSSIKHKKGAADAKRGKIFSKLAKAITSAARQGGGNPEMNIKLQYAIDKAKAENVPKDNIERAILKGTGELGGDSELFECIYEGYGSNGVAIMIEILTDNKNRTASEIRKIFERFGGNLGEPGCVSWMFQKKGMITVNVDGIEEDRLMTFVLDAGGEDLQVVGDEYQITCDTKDLNNIKNTLQREGINLVSAEISMIPNSFIELNETTGRKVISLAEALENHDDVQNVYANFELPKDLLEQLQVSKS
ncbi:MAG: YebC/PmpR family DNA-binding transcriptional regulator [Candidatus Scalindua sediminis]|nr:YebC/PmpR family DNA-binding transcriptional regulator [Candidatus Scalindua sediminis]